MRKIGICFVFVIFFLTGCMGHYWYHAMDEEGGYKDYLINPNTAVIIYEGDTKTSLTRLKRYLLYRAAEVTMTHAYDYFIVVSTTPSPFLMPLITPDYHKYMPAPAMIYPFQYTPNHFIAYNRSFPQREFPRFTCYPNKAVLTIEMFQGEVPATQPYGFAASDVVDRIDHAFLY